MGFARIIATKVADLSDGRSAPDQLRGSNGGVRRRDSYVASYFVIYIYEMSYIRFPGPTRVPIVSTKRLKKTFQIENFLAVTDWMRWPRRLSGAVWRQKSRQILRLR